MNLNHASVIEMLTGDRKNAEERLAWLITDRTTEYAGLRRLDTEILEYRRKIAALTDAIEGLERDAYVHRDMNARE